MKKFLIETPNQDSEVQQAQSTEIKTIRASRLCSWNASVTLGRSHDVFIHTIKINGNKLGKKIVCQGENLQKRDNRAKLRKDKQ
jgi:hypothetical protein